MQLNCRHFNGYRPCGKAESCDRDCVSFEPVASRLLLIHLGALGAVLRSTALLPAIRRKFPNSHITWVTESSAVPLLQNNTLIDRIVSLESNGLLDIQGLHFDAAFVVDKSLRACGILQGIDCDLIFGFKADLENAVIVPATPAAQELWEIGLSDHKKFFENKKPETQLICEALELGPWQRDDYYLNLTDHEIEIAHQRKTSLKRDRTFLLGINTGSSNTLAAKKLSVAQTRKLIEILMHEKIQIALLGGREDQARNLEIGKNLPIVQTSTELGLRDGILSVQSCDAIFTGDSLGLHLALALKKPVVAWFGPTCAHEIDFYNRGYAVLSGASCSPCWKRDCQKNPMCYDRLDLFAIRDLLYRSLNLEPHPISQSYCAV